MRHIRVSVAMATYNGEKYIQEQIRTILQNLTDNDELVISDDGSKDQTRKMIEAFQDKRIKFIQGPKKGIKQNFANAIKHTSGDIIFLADQDDIWMKNKVETVLKYFQNSDILLIQHDAIVIDSQRNILYESFSSLRNVKVGLVRNILKNSYHGCCIAFRKELKKEILPIPENIYLHDQWIGLIAEMNGNTKFIPEKLIQYRRHEQNASSFKHLPIHQIIKNRYQIIKSILHYSKNRGAQ